MNTGETYMLKAHFDNIGGLKVRAPVKSAGVVVGRVSDISLDAQRYEAVVTMNIGSQYKFPRDTFAKIRTSGLLGEQYIGLAVGGDERMLKPGDTVMKTESAMVLEDLVGQFLFDKAAEGKKTTPDK
jgi:phospholipid/cholesterol/gamma-HCH transport system substrate-binding protein